jgi:aquaporin Z
MRVALTEFIGTFFLVLTIALVVASGSALAPLAIGAMLMVMVYMGGHVSGAHFNPAVSVAVLMRGAMPAKSFVPYVLSQLAGATLAAYVGRMITGQTFAPVPADAATITQALLVEILFTFALALVVLNVAVAKRVQGNSYYGLAIGFTVAAAAFAGGGISGGAFNPAVGFGPTLVHSVYADGGFGSLWLYFVGPVVGGALAAVVFGVQEEAPAAAG